MIHMEHNLIQWPDNNNNIYFVVKCKVNVLSIIIIYWKTLMKTKIKKNDDDDDDNDDWNVKRNEMKSTKQTNKKKQAKQSLWIE